MLHATSLLSTFVRIPFFHRPCQWLTLVCLPSPLQCCTECVQVSKVKPNSKLRPGLIKHITCNHISKETSPTFLDLISITTIQHCLGRGGFYSLGERGRGDLLLLLAFAYVISRKWQTNQKRNVCRYVSELQEKQNFLMFKACLALK